jgi:hypothetical protein
MNGLVAKAIDQVFDENHVLMAGIMKVVKLRCGGL